MRGVAQWIGHLEWLEKKEHEPEVALSLSFRGGPSEDVEYLKSPDTLANWLNELESNGLEGCKLVEKDLARVYASLKSPFNYVANDAEYRSALAHPFGTEELDGDVASHRPIRPILRALPSDQDSHQEGLQKKIRNKQRTRALFIAAGILLAVGLVALLVFAGPLAAPALALGGAVVAAISTSVSLPLFLTPLVIGTTILATGAAAVFGTTLGFLAPTLKKLFDKIVSKVRGESTVSTVILQDSQEGEVDKEQKAVDVVGKEQEVVNVVGKEPEEVDVVDEEQVVVKEVKEDKQPENEATEENVGNQNQGASPSSIGVFSSKNIRGSVSVHEENINARKQNFLEENVLSKVCHK